MKYVFFGTPRFAEVVLRGLLDHGIAPSILVCNPDRPVGRKKILTAPPTKNLIEERLTKGGPYSPAGGAATAILQPEKLDEDFIRKLAAEKPDFFVVAAYAKIIPKAVLAIPRLGTIGVHPSLLPLYRGASPIQSAILDGSAKTGVTLYLMDEKMDHGPVLAQENIRISEKNADYAVLENDLAELGANMLVKTIPSFVAGKMRPEPQDESRATYTKKFTADDGRVDERDLEAAERGDKEKAERIIRMINAFTPEPGVWVMKGGKRIKLLKARLENGALKMLLTQTEGEKPKEI